MKKYGIPSLDNYLMKFKSFNRKRLRDLYILAPLLKEVIEILGEPSSYYISHIYTDFLYMNIIWHKEEDNITVYHRNKKIALLFNGHYEEIEVRELPEKILLLTIDNL